MKFHEVVQQPKSSSRTAAAASCLRHCERVTWTRPFIPRLSLEPFGFGMAFRITITEEADSQLRALPVREQRIVEAAVTARLRDQPAIPTKAIRRLRPNPLAEFELRVRDLRVLYNVEQDIPKSSC